MRSEKDFRGAVWSGDWAPLEGHDARPGTRGRRGGPRVGGCWDGVLPTRHNAGYRASGAAVIVDVDVLSLSEELRLLVEAAEERGRVRASRLAEVLEPLELDELETRVGVSASSRSARSR